MDHDQLKELLPLEAMGRLEGEEARAMSAHLAAGCDECEAELRSFRETLAAMAASENGEATSDRIWQRLERRLHENENIALRSATRATDRIDRPAAVRRWRVATAIASAAAIVLAILAANFAGQMGAAKNNADAQIAALQIRISEINRILDDRNRELIGLRREIATRGQLTQAVLAPDMHMIKLAPMAPAPDAAGLVAMSVARGQSMLEVAGLPPAPAGKTYELWWIGAKSGPVRAAIFNPAANGSATIGATMPPSGEALVASAITLEPAGGTDKPTGAMYLKGS